MCGFVAAIGVKDSDFGKKFRDSLTIISHRGPDASRVEVISDHGVYLGHNRLAIIDLHEASNQPFKYKDHQIVYNGEIYNHLELRETVLKDFDFKTHSDTETLIVGLVELGQGFLDNLEGMFAGVLVNETDGSYLAFRDGFGIKPNYYMEFEGALFFASEIKSFLKFRSANFCRDTLEDYLAFENYAQGKTFYEGIFELLPGEVFAGQKATFNRSLINPVLNDNYKDGKKALQQSINSHLLSDVELGVYLSGGIDSSLVAGVSSRSNDTIKGYTGYFSVDNQYYDERYYSRKVAEHNKIDLCEVEINSAHFIKFFDKLMWHLEQPRMGMGSFSQFVVADALKKDRKVVLAGHGGDELFAGYPMFKSFYLMQNLCSPKVFLQMLRSVKPKEFIWIFYVAIMKVLTGRFYFAPMIFGKKSKSGTLFSTKSNSNLLDQLFEYYQNVYIPGLLSVEDKVSMAHSVETRVPLWSKQIFQHAKTVSPEEKMKEGKLKAYWKNLASEWLPKDLLSAPKRGFPTPLRLWFKNELYEYICERLWTNPDLDKVMSRRSRRFLIWSHKNLWLPFSFDEKRSHKIWMLLCIESVMRQYNVEP